jgi:DNA repair/transcription protein MET18/MMS19
MLRTFCAVIFVRSLGVESRINALDLLHILLQSQGQAALNPDDDNVTGDDSTDNSQLPYEECDIMEAAITALDGEKDPRCLLRGLSLLSSTISLYSTQPEHSLAYGKLEESVDEAFDVLSCYFPIDFTPPPNDPYGISKEMLREELQGALMSCPLFVDQLVSLALEKLSSAVRDAKVDALDVLALSAEKLASSINNSTAAAAASIYDKGREMYLNQMSAIWAAIKLEIQSLANNNSDGSGGGGGGHTLPSSSSSSSSSSVKRQPLLLTTTTTTASRIFKSFPTHQPLIDLVLQDASITEDLISCLASPVPNQESETFHRSVGKIQASTAALSVLTLCGGEPRRQALSLVLPRIINILDTGNNKKEEEGRKGIESQVLCWTVIASLLQGEERGEGEEIQGILKKVFHMSLKQEEELEEKGGDEMKVDDEEEEEDSTDNEIIYWSREASEYNAVRLETQKLAALAAICATFGNASQISGGDGDVEQAVDHVLKIVSTDNTNSSSSSSLKSQAVSVLYSIVTTRSDLSGRVMQALMEAGNISAIQMLFRTTTTTTTKTKTTTTAAACRASHGLQVEIIAAFDQAIVENLLKTSQAEEASEKNKLKLVEITQGLHNIIEDATMKNSGVDSSSGKEDELGRAFSSLGSHIYQALLQTQHTTTDDDDDVDGCVMIIFQSFLAAAAAPPPPPPGMVNGTSTNSTAFDTALETSLTMLSNQTFNSKSSMAACCAVICASPSTILQQACQKTSAAVNTSSALITLLVNTALPITTTAAAAAHSPIYVMKWASLAAASLLNRAVSKEDVDVLCDSVFNTFLSASSKDKNTDDYYWKCVADITRSLAMRGAHKSSDKLLTQIILHSSSASASDVYNAITCLETILSPSTTTSTQNHMVSRSLWQQRFYSVAMNEVLKMQQQEGEEEGIMLFMAALIKNGPEKAVMQDLTRLGHQLPPLLASLASLSKEDDLSIDSNSATCICHLLLGVLSFIDKGLAADKASLFLPIMNSLLAQLISLATTFNPVSTARKSAFDLLALIGMKVDYSQLHGCKSQVVEAAIAGLDDAKRDVRRAAAACRLAWV